MATQTSRYLVEKILRHTLVGESFPTPGTVYLALMTSNPTWLDTGNEVVGNGYARQPLAFTLPELHLASNVSSVTFPTATGPWGRVTHFGIYTDVTAGKLLFFGQLNLPRDPAASNVVVTPAGNIQIDLSGEA